MIKNVPQPQVVRFKGLGPGFWWVTLFLGVISVINAWYFLYGNIDWIMPGASHPVADRASDVDALFKFMAVFGGAIMYYVAGYVIYFAIAFRARPTDLPDDVGVPIHDAPKLEFWWTLLPTLLLVVLTAFSINIWYKIQFGVGAPGLTAEVIGHQFYFEYRYPGLKSSVFSKTEDMHLPIGVPVRILITSADVIHQFWVPEIRLKQAAVPGLVQNLNYTPLRAGSYDIQCSEFCGTDHSMMHGKLVVEPVAAFNKWLDAQKKAAAAMGGTVDLSKGDASAGQKLFNTKCTACHQLAPFDQKLVGPGLLHITDDPAHPQLVTGKPPTPQNIAEIVTNGFTGPIGTMPNRQANGLSDQDIANAVAFLVSQK
ncbi:MAG: cytochrome c oxidase subunit II [Candidatus Eremiobacteraeota bacterium]|nr:cytochrome c oxidase subunit II [Candidatus Eremiobacteraeota bacterium]